jgi:hypothetical protein
MQGLDIATASLPVYDLALATPAAAHTIMH